MTTRTIDQTKSRSTFVADFMQGLTERNPGEIEFLQAVEECVASLELVLERHQSTSGQASSSGLLNLIESSSSA